MKSVNNYFEVDLFDWKMEDGFVFWKLYFKTCLESHYAIQFIIYANPFSSANDI